MRFIPLIISAVFILSGPDLLYSQSTQNADSVNNATTLRPIDIVSFQSGWNIASVDMYTFWINNGLYGNYGPQPEIMLDGLPVDVNFFGWQSLNMLPIYLPDLNKVISTTRGGTYKNNTFHPAGLIDFAGNKPDSGWSASAGVYLGNETGDPGPWIYDSTRVTPNVDRWGPDAGGVLSFGKNNWYGKGIFTLRRHQQTDPISHRRIHRTMRALGGTQFYPIQTNSQSGLFEGGYQSDTWKLKARGILAEDRNYLFLQPFGREVPAQTEYRQLALESQYQSENWELNLRYILDDKKINRRNSDHGYIFNWDETSNNFTGSAVYETESLQLSGRISMDLKKVKAPGLQEENYPITAFYWSTDWSKNKSTRYRISGGVNIHRKQTAKSAEVAYSRELNKYWKVNVNAFYNEVLPIRQQSFGYWITQGYNFHEELGISINQPLTISNNRLLNFRLNNIFDASETLSISFSSRITRHYELNIPWQSVNYNLDTGTEPGTFTISQEEGTRITLESTLKQKPLAWLDHSFSMQYQTTLEGSARYEEYFQQIPVAKLWYQISVKPVENLSLSLQGAYRSSAKWTEFKALDGEEYRDLDNLFPVFTGTYDSRVPAHVNIELGAQKLFWQKRLSLQFTIQNLLNDEIRMHPIGANKSLMFNIKAVAGF